MDSIILDPLPSASTADEATPPLPSYGFIDPTSSTLADPNDLLSPLVHDYAPVDLSLETLLMPPFFNTGSPSSSLSTPTTRTSLEDTLSSASSTSFTYTTTVTSSPVLGKVNPFTTAFLFNDLSAIDETLFNTSPYLEAVKQELSLNPFDTFNTDMSYVPLFKPESIHQSIEVPASPPQMEAASFQRLDAYDHTMSATIRPFQHAMPNFTTAYSTSSSDETMSEAPLPPPPILKKPTRGTKHDKGIKCDHCGVDKTPLWRKVPNKENAYHWYAFLCLYSD